MTALDVVVSPAVITQVHAAVIARLGGDGGIDDDAAEVVASATIVDELDHINRQRLAAGSAPLEPEAEQAVIDRVMALCFGDAIFGPYLSDDSVEDVVINGADTVFVSRTDGQWSAVEPLGLTDEALVEAVRAIASRLARTERRFDTAAPMLDLRLPDGSRLNAVMEVSGRPSVTLRRHRHVEVTLDDLIDLGTVDKTLLAFLDAAVLARLNVVVSGAQRVGKTTLLRALIASIPAQERIITIEDRLELWLSARPDRHPNIVELETRTANLEGVGEITMRDLVKNSLTMSADRIVLGEIRGAEVLDMLTAMSVGSDGSLCTVHASGTREAPNRLSTMCAMAPEALPRPVAMQLIRDSVDLFVHLDRDRATGDRVVSSIREVTQYTDSDGLQTNEIFAPDRRRRACPAAPPESDTRERLEAVGFDTDLLNNPAGSWDR